MFVSKEESFDIIIGAGGAATIVMTPRPQAPCNPFLVWDGGRGLALFRDRNEAVELSKIPRRPRLAIGRSAEARVSELDPSGKAVWQYRVRVVYDSRLKRKLARERRAPLGAV